MFLIRNAIKNIYRYRRKYITYGILFLLLITAASVCVGIYLRMSEATDAIVREYAGVSVLNVDLADIDLYNPPDRLTRKDFESLADIEHISDIKMFRYNFRTDFLKEDASPLNVTVNSSVGIEAPVFVLGYNTSLLHLTSEEFSLASGRMFEGGQECIISKNSKAEDETSAKWNVIAVGDTILISGSGVSREYTVVGILEENGDDTANTNRRSIYTSLEGAEYFECIARVEGAAVFGYSLEPATIKDIANDFDAAKDSSIGMGYEVLVYLDDPEEFLNVQDDFYQIELEGYFLTLQPMFSDFRSMLSMTRVMSSGTGGFMVITAILLIFVTVITTIMLLGTRKYEIAVLRSIGMKKSRLTVSYLIENLAFIWGITAVSFIIAQMISPIFTVHIFDGIQSMVSAEVYERIMGSFGLRDIMMHFGTVFGGATVIVLLSSLLSCINILRFEPLKIFNKRF